VQRILLVEDDATVARALVRQLRRFCDVVAVKTSVTDALAVLAEHIVDAVLSDFDLGAGGNGGELLRAVAERWPRVRRVLYSGSVEIVGERAASAQYVLQKPASLEELLTALGADR